MRLKIIFGKGRLPVKKVRKRDNDHMLRLIFESLKQLKIDKFTL